MFNFELTIYPEDIDSFGIVHHANFLKYMERARTAWLKQCGFRLDEWKKQGILFVIKKAELDFKLPAKLYDNLIVETTVLSRRRVSKIYQQTIYDAQDRDKIYCQGLLHVVCVDHHLKPRALPIEILGECSSE